MAHPSPTEVAFAGSHIHCLAGDQRLAIVRFPALHIFPGGGRPRSLLPGWLLCRQLTLEFDIAVALSTSLWHKSLLVRHDVRLAHPLLDLLRPAVRTARDVRSHLSAAAVDLADGAFLTSLSVFHPYFIRG